MKLLSIFLRQVRLILGKDFYLAQKSNKLQSQIELMPASVGSAVNAW